MITADIVAIALFVIFALLGLLVGFSKGLRFFTKGIFGFIISVFICYCIGGLILKISFVENLLFKFVGLLENKGTVCDILIKIHIELVVYYIALFIVVTILRCTVVSLFCNLFAIDNAFIKIVNRIFGVALFLGVLFFFTIIAFQIIYLIGGTTATGFADKLSGSIFKLDSLYENNPLMTIIKIITIKIEIPA